MWIFPPPSSPSQVRIGSRQSLDIEQGHQTEPAMDWVSGLSSTLASDIAGLARLGAVKGQTQQRPPRRLPSAAIAHIRDDALTAGNETTIAATAWPPIARSCHGRPRSCCHMPRPRAPCSVRQSTLYAAHATPGPDPATLATFLPRPTSILHTSQLCV
jgi:hypothetical protein